MSLVLPREEEVENMFSRILSSDQYCERLMDAFYDHLCDDKRTTDPDPHHFAEVLLGAYKNGDVSALLLELFNRSMFDLLKETYLIPKRFHGKNGENPVLLTDVDGNLLNDKADLVSRHEYKKFHEIYQAHHAAPRSKLYLADAYDLVRYYTSGMDICEKAENRERGILILYALPDTKKLGLTEAQAQEMYRYLAIANYEDRFVVPSSHRELAREAFPEKNGCGFTFGDGCHGSDTKFNLFNSRRIDAIDVTSKTEPHP